VTAEGVEDENALRLLRQFSCDHAQGYHVGKPLASRPFMGFVASSRGRWYSDVAETVP